MINPATHTMAATLAQLRRMEQQIQITLNRAMSAPAGPAAIDAREGAAHVREEVVDAVKKAEGLDIQA